MNINGTKVGRNEPCLCGSGNKFKKCCLPRMEGFILMEDGMYHKRPHIHKPDMQSKCPICIDLGVKATLNG